MRRCYLIRSRMIAGAALRSRRRPFYECVFPTPPDGASESARTYRVSSDSGCDLRDLGCVIYCTLVRLRPFCFCFWLMGLFLYFLMPSWPSGQPKRDVWFCSGSELASVLPIGRTVAFKAHEKRGRHSSVISHLKAHRDSPNSLTPFPPLHRPRSTTTADPSHSAGRSALIWRPGQDFTPTVAKTHDATLPGGNGRAGIFAARDIGHHGRSYKQAQGASCRNRQLNPSVGFVGVHYSSVDDGRKVRLNRDDDA